MEDAEILLPRIQSFLDSQVAAEQRRQDAERARIADAVAEAVAGVRIVLDSEDEAKVQAALQMAQAQSQAAVEIVVSAQAAQ